MAEEYSRSTRVAEQMQRELSVMIRRELRDPRLALVSVTRVDLSPDLGYARVYVHSLDPNPDREGIVSGLTKAAGFLRGQIGKRLRLRIAAQFEFHYDQGLEAAAEMDVLIAAARAHDRSGAQADTDDKDSDKEAD